MSPAPWVRTLGRVLHNAPAVASIGWRHVGRDGTHGLLIALRLLPRGLRRRVADWSDSRPPSALGAIALAADGRAAEAVEATLRAARTATPRRLRLLAAAAAALDAPAEAKQIIGLLAAQDPARHRIEALVAAQAGDLVVAERHAQEAGPRAAGLRRRVAGELAAVTTLPMSGSRARRVTRDSRRILHLVTNSLPETTAGYTVRTQGIAAAQRREGRDAHVVTRLGYPLTVGRVTARVVERVDGVPYHRLLPFRWLPVEADRALDVDVEETARLVRRLRPGILHAHSKYANAQVALALRERFDLGVVYEVRGFLEETWRSRGHDASSDTYRLAREAETRCMDAADAIVTLAESMRAEIVARGVEPGRVAVVPNAVDSGFLADPPDPSSLRRRLGFADRDLVIGVVTTLNAYEGLDTLIVAARELLSRRAPVRLLIVGDGAVLSDLRRLAAESGLRDDVVFTGAVPFTEIRQYYAALDVFCVPRADVPVTRLVPPLKPLEAMATGRPVVASDLAPLREIVIPGQTGALATPGDPVLLADALEPLVSDSAARARMGRTANAWVAEYRTWDAVAKTYLEIYARLATP